MSQQLRQAVTLKMDLRWCRLFIREGSSFKQATRHLTLEIVGYTPALQGDEVCDFSFGLSPTRLMHRVKNSVKDAPQNADLPLDRVRWRLATNVRS